MSPLSSTSCMDIDWHGALELSFSETYDNSTFFQEKLFEGLVISIRSTFDSESQ